jgi:hypothetical protein
MTLHETDLLSRVRYVLFEAGVSRLIFEHARNLVVAMFVLAAGLEAIEHDPRAIGPLYFRSTGYVVASVGAALVLLNLSDGMHRLSKATLPRLWHSLLVVTYVVVFWRVAHLILLFR